MSNILQEAEALVFGDREQQYGSPTVSLAAVANLWNMHLKNLGLLEEGGKRGQLTAEDVAALMLLLKLARLTHSPRHRDSLVDICGYAALIERIHCGN